ncbi:ABC transporter permease [Salipiger abyssi]|uniref:ABC transporter permease n=1 Tax=Salipiger abyssi TaxID=1250539 RepID=UPI00405A0BCB
MHDQPIPRAVRLSALSRLWDSDIAYAFRTSPVAVLSALTIALFIVATLLAPWLAPQNPFDPAALDIMDSNLPPAFTAGGDTRYLLGTDDQGRDLLSGILFGARISLIVGIASVAIAVLIGIGVGLAAGYLGGWVDAVLMRLADIQLAFPAILLALLIDGIARTVLPPDWLADLQIWVIVGAIAISTWVQYARTVRALVMSEKRKEYVLAGHVMGLSNRAIVFRHILPNVLTPVFVIGTINFALAIMIESSLSFLGLGVPPTSPSLGTLIRIGSQYLFSGEWWITLFPALALVTLALAVNLLGDWMRDTLNPKLGK